ncbi:MAG: DUF1631 family protein [Gammaproteobacteria bacterium]|nr:DUF1631 family protein [Gammaproteobacteria bacterium]
MAEEHQLDRRLEPRQLVELNALLHPDHGRSWLCTIRDFCSGGMLLVSEGRNRENLAATGGGAKRGDPVNIHFCVPSAIGGQQNFRLTARIARTTEYGVGVQFIDGIETGPMDALLDFAARNADSAPRERTRVTRTEMPSVAAPADQIGTVSNNISVGDRRRIKRSLRRLLKPGLASMNKAFFKRLDKELLLRARDAGSNQEQNGFFDALTQVEKRRRRIAGDFSRAVLDQIEHIADIDEVVARRAKQSSEGDRIALVATDDFEDWLAVAEIIAKAENRYASKLFEIRQRLGMLEKAWHHTEIVPVGPPVLARAFYDAIGEIAGDKDTRQVYHTCFEQAVVPVLGNLYARIVDMLERSGVFPSSSEMAGRVVNRGANDATPRVSASPPIAEPVQPGPGFAAPQPASALPPGASAAPAGYGLVGPAPQPLPIVPALDAPLGLALGGATGGGSTGIVWSNAYQAARTLMNLDEQVTQMQIAATDPQLSMTVGTLHAARRAQAHVDQIPTFELQDVVQALDDMQVQAASGVKSNERVKTRLLRSLNAGGDGGERRMDNVVRDSIDVVENLVTSIHADALLTEGIKDWVGKLEITLSKVAAQDEQFINSTTESPHAALMMLNQLAQLGSSGEVGQGIDREIGEKVDAVMQRVIDDYNVNPDVFYDALTELDPLVERQTRAYSNNFDRTVKACEGQERLARSQRAVLAEMESRLVGSQVPAVILKLLVPGWRNLLVNTHLRKGSESEAWRNYLGVIDQWLAHLDPDKDEKASPDYMPPDKLLVAVSDGLESISYEPGQRVPLLNSLQDYLAGREDPAVNMVLVGEKETAEVLEFDSDIVVQEPIPAGVDERDADDWRDALARVRRIQAGDWIALTGDQGHTQILSTAWIGEQHASFVFVNRKGVKERELTLKQMTAAVKAGNAEILDEWDMPLVDRASHRMLQNMHNELAYHASHDALTGLMNRKEFERRLDEVVSDAIRRGLEHVLLYMDLDQFKVINNTSGHIAGDELLRDVSERLTRASQDGNKTIVARLGGDEFGVLIERCSSSEGVEMAERQLNTIRDVRFEWEDRHYQITASIGVVPVNAHSESAAAVMQRADATCFAAKDAGRNRIQLFEPDDAVLSRQIGAMEWVACIDKAIEEDRLVLNYQRIEPIARPDPMNTHYEILLTMIDEQGEIMPPGEFIPAAESFNRMEAIDSWVIRHALDWMSKHARELQSFGGFSINVSGNSLNSEAFLDFVLRELSETQVPTDKVIFEITETAAIANLDDTADFMRKMKIIGCQFSLDDFGTGLSSYSYLRNLPVDYVKIDGVFVKDLAVNPADYAIVKSINEIAHFMGKKTVAEFVENDDILELLREIGVDYAQGFGIEKPRPLAGLG